MLEWTVLSLYNVGNGGAWGLNAKVMQTMEFAKVTERLMSHAATSLGKRRAEALLPDTNYESVVEALATTDEATQVDRLKGMPPFGGIRDGEAAIRRARIGSMLAANELLDIATTMQSGRRLRRFIHTVHEDYSIPRLVTLSDGVADLKSVEDAIFACIDDHAEVMDKASPALSKVRAEIRIGEARVREKLEQMVRNSSVQKMLQEAIVTLRNDRYCLPVKQEYRASVPGIVHDQSASGATLFVEPEAVVQSNNKLRELRLMETREVEKILAMLTAEIANVADVLLYGLEAIAELDFSFAKAGLAREWKATMPKLNQDGVLRLRKARHPLIPASVVVPIDIELEAPYRALIVTGPNTGGKTVTLKTVGLLSLMTMSGLFIPVEEDSEVCMFDGVYADIGDEQSIEQSLSTFSSHMTNLIKILDDVTSQSLVLLDELGAGTDPAEGSALAIAILEHLHAVGCMMLATTHYSELKAYAYEREGIRNASMEFDVQSLRPTYRLLVGIPGRSNAFAIAERLGLRTDIIRHAETYVGDDERRVETMIASLQENRLGAEAERATAAELRKQLEAERAELARQRERLAEQRDKVLAKAEQDGRDAVAKARAEAEAIIAELRQAAMDERASMKEHKLIDAKRKLDQANPSLLGGVDDLRPARQAAKVQVGDDVTVISLKQKGIVIEKVSETEALVQIGILKMKLPTTDLEVLKATKQVQKKQPQQAATAVKRSRDDNIRMELDLRGENLEDAIVEVDRFLDEAIMSNLGSVYIIHGKGTGILRVGIGEFLRRHKHVGTYRLGNYGEGGIGVTVVELK
jgi:DNA mismatch repair protein MutS2